MKRRWFTVAVLTMVLVSAAFLAGCGGGGTDGGPQPPSGPAGSLSWVKRAGGNRFDYGQGIAAFSDGSVAVTGAYWDAATFGAGEPNETNLSTLGGIDIFVARYDASGSVAWAKGTEGTGADEAHSVAVFPDGSCVATGVIVSWAKFGPGEANETRLDSAGADDVFLARYSSGGSLAWATCAGGISWDKGRGVVALSDGSCMVTGTIRNTATFGSGESNETSLPTNGPYDVFVARYNSDGSLAWAKQAGGAGDDGALGIALLADDSAVVTGYYQQTALFDPGEPGEESLTSAGDFDIFIARYNPDGTLAWARSAGGTNADKGCDVAVLSDGSIAVTGYFEFAATFGPGEAGERSLTSEGVQDIFVARYGADGSLAWVRHAGGNMDDQGYAVAALSGGSAVVTGRFRTTATFGAGELNETSLGTAGETDAFVARYEADGSLAWAKRAGGSEWDGGGDIAVTPNGWVVVVGNFQLTASFGEGEPNETVLTSAGDSDIFIARFNP